jgi:hypothetical protein
MRTALAAMLGGCVTALHVTAPAPVITSAPAFSLTGQDGQLHALATTPTVLVFYRGFW